MSDGVFWFNKRPQGNEIENLLFTGSGECTWHALRGHTGRSRQRCSQRQWQGPGHMSLLISMGGVPWNSQSKVGLVNSNQKVQVMISSMGLLSNKHRGEGPGR